MSEYNNVPKIRFKGFTDVWEQRKAKELCSITTGKSNTQDQVMENIRFIFALMLQFVVIDICMMKKQ